MAIITLAPLTRQPIRRIVYNALACENRGGGETMASNYNEAKRSAGVHGGVLAYVAAYSRNERRAGTALPIL